MTTWCDKNVTVYSGHVDDECHDFGNEFPFIVAEDEGCDIVVPVWSMTQSNEWDCEHIGVKLNDLITGFIETECVKDRDEAIKDRIQLIKALNISVERLCIENIMEDL